MLFFFRINHSFPLLLKSFDMASCKYSFCMMLLCLDVAVLLMNRVHADPDDLSDEYDHDDDELSEVAVQAVFVDGDTEDTLFNLPQLPVVKQTRSLLDVAEKDIPASFDARDDPLRQEWRVCSSIRHTRNQGRCSSCFAYVASSVIADRVCIAGLKAGRTGKDLFTGLISATQSLTCPEMRSGYKGDGGSCSHGGQTKDVYKYAGLFGMVTGGEYTKNPGKSDCLPMPFDVTRLKKEQYPEALKNLKCSTTCWDNYPPMAGDLYYIDGYWLIERNKLSKTDIPGLIPRMQLEIMNNGPIHASMFAKKINKIFSDGYESALDGVYTQEDLVNHDKSLVGDSTGHAVRIVGWGVSPKLVRGKNAARRSQAPTKYWIVGNSWGEGFGDRGFFWVERGINALNIESRFSAPVVSFANPCKTADFCAGTGIDQAVWSNILDPTKPKYLFQGQCAQEVRLELTGNGPKLTASRAAIPTNQKFFHHLVLGNEKLPRSDYLDTFDGLWLFQSDGTKGAVCNTVTGSAKFLCLIAKNTGPKEPVAQFCMAGETSPGVQGRICYTYEIKSRRFFVSSGKGKSDADIKDVGDLLAKTMTAVKTFMHVGSSNVLVFGLDAAQKAVVSQMIIPFPVSAGGHWQITPPVPIAGVLTCPSAL